MKEKYKTSFSSSHLEFRILSNCTSSLLLGSGEGYGQCGEAGSSSHGGPDLLRSIIERLGTRPIALILVILNEQGFGNTTEK
jgi:hypothetical protein